MSERNNISTILEAVKGMSAIELMDLVRSIENEFGVSAAIQVAVGAGGGDAGDAEPAKAEKTEFKVIIKEVGSNAINVIKAIRAVLPGLGLKEAKDLAVAGAVVKEGVNKEEAEKIKKALQDAGATADML